MELPSDHNERRVGGNCLDNMHRESSAEAISNGLTPETVAVSTTVSNKYRLHQNSASAVPPWHCHCFTYGINGGGGAALGMQVSHFSPTPGVYKYWNSTQLTLATSSYPKLTPKFVTIIDDAATYCLIRSFRQAQTYVQYVLLKTCIRQQQKQGGHCWQQWHRPNDTWRRDVTKLQL